MTERYIINHDNHWTYSDYQDGKETFCGTCRDVWFTTEAGLRQHLSGDVSVFSVQRGFSHNLIESKMVSGNIVSVFSNLNFRYNGMTFSYVEQLYLDKPLLGEEIMDFVKGCVNKVIKHVEILP